MSDSDPPSPPDESTRRIPPSANDRDGRKRLGVVPEIVRRVVELGVEKARESPDSFKQLVGDLKLPKEIAHYLLQQIDETKSGVFRVVAKEMRDFLEHTNLAGEMQKILTTVQFEITTTIRFKPNDGRESPGNNKDDDEETEASLDSEKGESANEPSDENRQSSVPKPEVKTAVRVRRDERRRRST
ncbi:MAG: hypothetical protein FWD69_15900 [Polyangiaceae bacterium]|nr:hypothetical protein [Polyangiaceae bacterium]